MLVIWNLFVGDRSLLFWGVGYGLAIFALQGMKKGRVTDQALEVRVRSRIGAPGLDGKDGAGSGAGPKRLWT